MAPDEAGDAHQPRDAPGHSGTPPARSSVTRGARRSDGCARGRRRCAILWARADRGAPRRSRPSALQRPAQDGEGGALEVVAAHVSFAKYRGFSQYPRGRGSRGAVGAALLVRGQLVRLPAAVIRLGSALAPPRRSAASAGTSARRTASARTPAGRGGGGIEHLLGSRPNHPVSVEVGQPRWWRRARTILPLAAHTLAGTNLLWLGGGPRPPRRWPAPPRAAALTVLTRIAGAARGLTLRGAGPRARAGARRSARRSPCCGGERPGVPVPGGAGRSRRGPRRCWRSPASVGFTFWTPPGRGAVGLGAGRARRGGGGRAAARRGGRPAARRGRFPAPFGLALLAEVDGRGGRAGDALRALDEALATVVATGERWGRGGTPTGCGASCWPAWRGGRRGGGRVRAALAVAREQGAAWWELRAALGLGPALATAGQAGGGVRAAPPPDRYRGFRHVGPP